MSTVCVAVPRCFSIKTLPAHFPVPPYTAEDKKEVAELVYRHIWQQSASGLFGSPYKATEAP